MGWLYKNEITGQFFEGEENDAVVYLPLLEKAILRNEDTVELIRGVKKNPSLIALLSYLLNKEAVNKFCFRKAVTENKTVVGIKGEVDYERVNIAFVCLEDKERINFIYL